MLPKSSAGPPGPRSDPNELGVRGAGGVSVADSHIGAVIQSAAHGQITVVTSDPGDTRLVAGDKNITVAAI